MNNRRKAEARAGWAMLAGVALASAGILAACYQADKAAGISVSESLASHGIGRAAISPAMGGERARPARLIGRCNGVLLAGMEESDFPMDCQWIERIRADNR